MALCFVAGAAIAQTSGAATSNDAKGGSGTNIGPFASEAEQTMYEENKAAMSGFFTDETMQTLKSDEEISTAFQAMDAEGQAGMKSACQKAAEDRGSYGTVTVSLCERIGAM
jgi:hypothetical protein